MCSNNEGVDVSFLLNTGFVEFIIIYVTIMFLLIIIKPWRKLKKLSIKDLTLDFDFYIDTRSSSKMSSWSVNDIETNSKLSLEDFIYFITNKVYQNVPLSLNDEDNFEELYIKYRQFKNFENTAKIYYKKNYLFNIKFDYISKLVQEYKKVKKDVCRKLNEEVYN